MRHSTFSVYRRIGAFTPLILLLAYGLLVSSPRGEAGGGTTLRVTVDPRLELAGIVGKLATDSSPVWPGEPTLMGTGARFNAQSGHAAVRRVRGWIRHGFTPELLAAILMQRGPLPDLKAGAMPLNLMALGPVAGARLFDPVAAGFTPASLDSLVSELGDFAATSDFDAAWRASEPLLQKRGEEIETDPTFRHLTARLADFFGESPVDRAVVAPTLFGAWRAPFAFYGPAEGQVTVVDRAPSSGRPTPDNSLSWACAREYARPLLHRITSGNSARLTTLAGYWDYFKQGVAATTTTGWEDCLNAHLFRAIDLRVRPQEDAVERELRISSALDAGLGMIRAVDGALSAYDRSRGFYRNFSAYFPTFVDELGGLEPRVRVERPRLGIKTTPTGQGLRITQISPGWSAEASGLLRLGDVLLAADGRPLPSEDPLRAVIQTKRIGDDVALSLERGGTTQTVTLALSKGFKEYEFFPPAPAAGSPAGTPAARNAGGR